MNLDVWIQRNQIWKTLSRITHSSLQNLCLSSENKFINLEDGSIVDIIGHPIHSLNIVTLGASSYDILISLPLIQHNWVLTMILFVRLSLGTAISSSFWNFVSLCEEQQYNTHTEKNLDICEEYWLTSICRHTNRMSKLHGGMANTVTTCHHLSGPTSRASLHTTCQLNNRKVCVQQLEWSQKQQEATLDVSMNSS